MSQPVEHSDLPGRPSSGGGLETLRQSSAIRGPLEPVGDSERSLTGHDHSSDHLALIYESSDEQFAAVVPFVREGIERGERCLYIADENSREEVLAALRDGGVDVDAALETGQLSIRSAEETYLSGGEFDLDKTRALLEDAVKEGVAEYEGFRVTAEETWLVGDEAAQRGFVDCEAHVNEFIDGDDALALCQYDRTQLPTAVIEDVIEIHPYLIYDNTVCRNFYYTPPEEYFGSDRPSHEVDRKLATLVDRTDARVTLRNREQYRHELYDVVSDTDASFDEKLEQLLELGRERFGLEIGYFARTDDGTFEIVDAVGPSDQIEAGVTGSLANTYCERLLAAPGPMSVTNAAAEGWADDPAYQRFGLDAYFATTVSVGATDYGTLCFASETPHERGYTDAERTFLDLMGQWLSYELNRRHRERYLRESYEITSDPDRSFDEKLEALLELGCERFGLEMAGLNHLPSWDGEFRLEMGVGFDVDGPLWTDPDEGCFCRRTIEQEEPVSMRDVSGTDWEDDWVHRELGLTSYLGTKVSSGATPYGTLWFASTDSRDRPFSDAERTFLELIGQWVSTELERTDRDRAQRDLYDITADPDLSFEEKTERLLDLGRDRFGLDMGFFLEKEGDQFRVIKTLGTDLEEGVATLSACPNQYCKQTITLDVPVGVEDAAAAGWDDDPLYETYDLGCYLGTRVTDGDGVYGSVCFASNSARKREFTDAEYAFLDLMGQWLSYELERQQRETELRESKEQLERIFESSHDAIFINDPAADEILDANRAGCEMLGYSQEEICSRGPSDFHPQEMDQFRAFVDDVYEEGSGWTDDLTCLHSDGTQIPVEMSASRIEYDDRQCMLAIVRDISERKEHERSQHRLYEIAADPDRSFEEKLQAVFELGCDRFEMELGGIAKVDPSTDRFEVEFASGDDDRFESGAQYPLSKMYCNDIVEAEETHAITDPTTDSFDEKLCYEEFGIRSYLGSHLDLESTDDRTFWFVSTESRAEFSEAERTFHHLMGQWVKYELERQQYERDLEETIDRLQQSNDRLKQFAYAASHDLQEPLRMVSSYLQLLEKRYRDDLDEDAREFIDFAVDGADRMRAMVDDLLAFSRVEESDGEFRPVDCDAVLERVSEDLQVQIEENGAELVVDSLPTVTADSEQLEQLFCNLVSNGIKYNDSESPQVEVRAEERADHWRFAVADNGIGIDPDRTNQIFEVFKRLHHDDEYPGTGIGLSLCQEIVENHGGEIRVESEPGAGSTFYITLPKRDPS